MDAAILSKSNYIPDSPKKVYIGVCEKTMHVGTPSGVCVSRGGRQDSYYRIEFIYPSQNS